MRHSRSPQPLQFISIPKTTTLLHGFQSSTMNNKGDYFMDLEDQALNINHNEEDNEVYIGLDALRIEDGQSDPAYNNSVYGCPQVQSEPIPFAGDWYSSGYPSMHPSQMPATGDWGGYSQMCPDQYDSGYAQMNTDQYSTDYTQMESLARRGLPSLSGMPRFLEPVEEVVQESDDYTELFTTDRIFGSREEAIEWVKTTGIENNMCIRTGRTKKSTLFGQLGKTWLVCEREGVYTPKRREVKEVQETIKSKKCGCKFAVTCIEGPRGLWRIEVVHGLHNC